MNKNSNRRTITFEIYITYLPRAGHKHLVKKPSIVSSGWIEFGDFFFFLPFGLKGLAAKIQSVSFGYLGVSAQN